MKKRFLCLLAATLTIGHVFAQQSTQFKIEKSEEFDEPDYGWNKIMQLKNGNTLFFHSTKKDGIDIVVYNSQRKQIATETLESNRWDVRKMRQSKVVGLYEINNEPVLFLVQADEHKPTLYRMRLNANTGKVIKEDVLGALPKQGLKEGYAMAFGNVDMPDIIVEKDPYSDCYAVVFFDGMSPNRNTRIKMTHYDGTHKVLNTAYYDSPDGKYKYLRYIGAAVDGSKRAFVAAYGYNGKADEDTNPTVIVSRINAGEAKFSHSLIKVSNDFNDTKSVMLFNKNTNKIQLMTLTYAKGRSDVANDVYFGSISPNYVYKKQLSCISLLNYIDPESLNVVSVKPLMCTRVESYGQQNIDKEYEFDGVPQNMILNKDNTTTILMEELASVKKHHAGRSMMSMGTTTYTTQLGPIGISELSDTGAEMNGYAISKLQQAQGKLPILYMSGRAKGIFAYPMNNVAQKSDQNQFLSYDYINTDKGHYVIFNELPGNAERGEEDEKRKMVKSVSTTNTICYKLTDPKMEKTFLFGEPDGKKESTFCYIESSDYNKEIGTYATMIVERDGRSKQARIAWITFQ